MARESATHRVDFNSVSEKGSCGELPDVVITGDIRPVLAKDEPAKLALLAESDGLEGPSAFKTEGEAADAGEHI